MNPTRRCMSLATAAAIATLVVSLWSSAALAQGAPLKVGVDMLQPDREKNDAPYRPVAQHLSSHLGRPVELRTVDRWEGLAKSLANGETDIDLMGPWGHVLANRVIGLKGGKVALDVAACELDSARLQDLYGGRQDSSYQYSAMALRPASASVRESRTTSLMRTPHERPFLA